MEWPQAARARATARPRRGLASWIPGERRGTRGLLEGLPPCRSEGRGDPAVRAASTTRRKSGHARHARRGAPRGVGAASTRLLSRPPRTKRAKGCGDRRNHEDSPTRRGVALRRLRGGAPGRAEQLVPPAGANGGRRPERRASCDGWARCAVSVLYCVPAQGGHPCTHRPIEMLIATEIPPRASGCGPILLSSNRTGFHCGEVKSRWDRSGAQGFFLGGPEIRGPTRRWWHKSVCART